VKDANRSTHIDTGDSEQKEAPKQPRSGKEQRAAPGSPKQQDNQRELGVGSDHLTEAMRRSKRGTFP
jgi:hypothetical protein